MAARKTVNEAPKTENVKEEKIQIGVLVSPEEGKFVAIAAAMNGVPKAEFVRSLIRDCKYRFDNQEVKK